MNIKLGKILKTGWRIAIAFGFVVGCFVIYSAWQHNPQQAYHSAEKIEWINLSLLGLIWWLIISTIVGGITSVCSIIGHKIYRHFTPYT
ncbi:hypothetical protein ACR30L_06790 [Psychromonas sp. PT13]|uniref:hypothetical protein n=1 Tax=Psychromonas sp. PT13 TaxID=3439547 RepID=UPI003EBFC8CE